MSDWKEKIEAQLVEELGWREIPDDELDATTYPHYWYDQNGQPVSLPETMQALLDVAVAAERLYKAGYDGVGLMQAFDKLREASDE